MERRTGTLLLLWLALLLAGPLHAQLVLRDDRVTIDAVPLAEVFRDTTMRMTVDEVSLMGNFRRNDAPNFYLEYKERSVLWIRLRIRNESSRKIFLIDVPNATIDDVQFYEPGPAGGFSMQQAGDAFPYRYREVFSRAFTFQINLGEHQARDYYLRIRANGDAINTSVSVWQPVGYLNQTANEKYVFGLYYGAILFIIVFHLFLYFRLKEKSLIYYMLYVGGFAGMQLTMDGFMSKYFLQEFPWLVNRLLPGFIYMATSSLIGFFQHYQSTRKFHKTAHARLNLLKYVSWVLAGACFLSHDIFLLVLPTASFFALISLITVLLTAGLALRTQPVLARYFISAFVLLVVGVLFGIVRAWGVHIPGSEYGLKLGAGAEIIVLAFALAEKFKLMEEAASQLALERLENLNQLKDQYSRELERTVQERTNALEKSNQSITDSIRYAKRIQSSLLPTHNLLATAFPDFFVYYQPRDIVSGDFYWFGQTGQTVVAAVVDCTGHGVPGAFMSILGMTSLHEIVNVKHVAYPDHILHAMNASIRKSLHQDLTQGGAATADGMDAAIICYNLDTDTVYFSGAKRPLIYFQDGELHELKGSKPTIGGKKGVQKEFERHSIPASSIETMYLFTDGYADQFGGNEDRKFMISRFRELLTKIRRYPMSLQQEYLDHAHQEWKGNQRQLDDILVLGLRFSYPEGPQRV